MTGLAIDTLRAWERRYGAVTPARDERGRLYSEADVRRLTLLRDAVARGHAIGRVATLPDADLRRIAATSAAIVKPPRPTALKPPAFDTPGLLDALERLDAVAVEHQIWRFAAMLTPIDLLGDVIVPVLAEVGDTWQDGGGRIAHEHLLSAIVRNVLGSFLRMHHRRDGAARLLFATPSGERHELGALGAATLAATSGLSVLYLGPDVPAGEIADTAHVSNADVAVLGITFGSANPGLGAEMARLAGALSPDVELWVGGAGARSAEAALPSRALIVDDYDALLEQFARIAGK